MYKHPLRKLLGLTVLYSIVIVGIFILQFKTESVFTKTLGDLKFSLSQTQTENNETVLKNRISVSYRGISFNTNEKKPVTAIAPDGTKTALELSSYEETGENSVRFSFAQGGYIEFLGTPEDSQLDFTITANIPENYESIILPYEVSQQYAVEGISSSSFMLTSKTGQFSFNAHEFSDSSIAFTAADPMARVSVYEAVHKFTFDQVDGYEGTTISAFERVSDKLRGILVSKVKSRLDSSDADSLTELDITAYVAELSSQGRYNMAIDSIPDSFKKGNKRSFVSAPFFNNLASMYRSLTIQDEKYASLVASKSLDVFNADGISDYLLRQKKNQAVKDLLSVPSKSEVEPTPYQAAGILKVYANLYKKDRLLASLLEDVLVNCVITLENSSRFENGILTLWENEDTMFTTEQAAAAGIALANYGKIKNNDTLVKAGYLAFHSALNSPDVELRTISSLYRILAPDNSWYPHTEILGWYDSTCVWAWTCAKGISYIHQPEDTANIFIDFPLNLTHYVMFSGVPNFHGKIEIQGQMFRSDARFETYNSSGYIYQKNNSALLIKSRHKSKMELIRLFFDEKISFDSTTDISKMPDLPKPAAKAEKPKAEQPPAPSSQSEETAAPSKIEGGMTVQGE